MSAFSYVAFYDGQFPSATDLNQNWDSIKTLVNGNLDRENILTTYAQYAIPLRAEIPGLTNYELVVNMPTRAQPPTSSKLLSVSIDAYNSGSSTNDITVAVYAGATLVKSIALTVGATSQVNTSAALGGTTIVNSTTPLKITVTTTANFASGDQLTVTVFLAQEIMSQAEAES